MSRLITVAIHTYEKALPVKALLEREGIAVTLQNVNLQQPEVSSGVRLRIDEKDLPLALRIIENADIFMPTAGESIAERKHSVLVPVDFSELSYKAVVSGFRLAKRHKQSIVLLHSYMAPHITANLQLTNNLTYDINDVSVNQIIGDINKNMEALNNRIKSDIKAGLIPAVQYSFKIVEGVPEDAIVEYAKSDPPFLVVMATRSWARKERDLIGSVTAEVLDECRFSVLTVPETADAAVAGTPQQILFFSNLDQSDMLAIDTLHRLFPESASKVTIVNITQRRRFSTERDTDSAAMALADYCSRNFRDYEFETVPIAPKDAIEELRRLNSEHHYSLIVVPNRKKNVFSRIFNPGLAHKLLFQADVSILAIPV